MHPGGGSAVSVRGRPRGDLGMRRGGTAGSRGAAAASGSRTHWVIIVVVVVVTRRSRGDRDCRHGTQIRPRPATDRPRKLTVFIYLESVDSPVKR